MRAPDPAGRVRSVSNVVSALIDLVSRDGSTRLSSSPRARRTSDGPSSPSRRLASRSLSACRWPSRVIPCAASRRARAGPTPGSSRTGSVASSVAASAAPITAKPRGLSRPAAIFAISRLAASPMDTVTPTVASTSRANRASTTAGGAPCSACGAGQIKHRLVDRQRLQQRRQRRHHGADLPSDCDVFGEVRPDHHRVGTRLQRLEHRHRAAHAINPGDVAGGGDHAAHAAADDDRPCRKLRPVALLHAGVERVAIDMRDGQVEQLGMPHDARSIARRTAWPRTGHPALPNSRGKCCCHARRCHVARSRSVT